MARLPPAVLNSSKIGLFLFGPMISKTDAFLLKASKLHSKLIKDIKQTALKVT